MQQVRFRWLPELKQWPPAVSQGWKRSWLLVSVEKCMGPDLFHKERSTSQYPSQTAFQKTRGSVPMLWFLNIALR